jgi:maltooligosyltrehalose trehalohydrolase
MAFEVWAPAATALSALVDGRELAMEPTEGGWWAPVTEHEWGPDIEYGYRLNGSEDLTPDPRSRRQPYGVHGPSLTVSPSSYAWTDAGWRGRPLRGGLIYELHIGTFTPVGTFDAAIQHLDHLVSLGVNFVELMPVNAFNGTHNWGYDGVLWFAVHEQYGGPDGYQRFVDACHSKGLAVIQDVVYNHLGPSGNYLPGFGPYLGSATNAWGASLNLDGPDSGEVRQYILDNALMWLRDYHVDGLRLDAVHELVDASDQHILAQLSERVDALAEATGRQIVLIAESDLNDDTLIRPRSDGGYGLTAQWSDDYHHAAHAVVTGEKFGHYADFDSLFALAKATSEGFVHDGVFSAFRGRTHGLPIHRESVQLSQLITFTQNHDQVGNRAQGDRTTEILDADSLAIQAVLTMMTPFTPMIFMGEEWGAKTPWQFFTSHPEPELGIAVADGRATEFARMGWDGQTIPDPQDPDVFDRSTLNWAEIDEPQHRSLLELYRTLSRLRHELHAFKDDKFETVHCQYSEFDEWLRIDRTRLSIAINFASQAREIPVPWERVLLATSPNSTTSPGRVHLPPRSAAILSR